MAVQLGVRVGENVGVYDMVGVCVVDAVAVIDRVGVELEVTVAVAVSLAGGRLEDPIALSRSTVICEALRA